jgi:biopolymer transport protein ExbB/TolQ
MMMLMLMMMMMILLLLMMRMMMMMMMRVFKIYLVENRLAELRERVINDVNHAVEYIGTLADGHGYEPPATW